MAAPLEEEAAPLLEEAAAMWRGTICEREGLLLQELPRSTQSLRCLSELLHDLFDLRSRLGVHLAQPKGSGQTYSLGDRPTQTRGQAAPSFRRSSQRLSYTAETGPSLE